MHKSILFLIYLGVCFWPIGALAQSNPKPVVFIAGEGNVSVESLGVGAAGAGYSSVILGGASHKAINKHDQTMEMAQNLLKDCPTIQITLDGQSALDYFVNLNREGHPTAFGCGPSGFKMGRDHRPGPGPERKCSLDRNCERWGLGTFGRAAPKK